MARGSDQRGIYSVWPRKRWGLRYGVYVSPRAGVFCLVDLASTRWGARRLMRRAAARQSLGLVTRQDGAR